MRKKSKDPCSMVRSKSDASRRGRPASPTKMRRWSQFHQLPPVNTCNDNIGYMPLKNDEPSEKLSYILTDSRWYQWYQKKTIVTVTCAIHFHESKSLWFCILSIFHSPSSWLPSLPFDHLRNRPRSFLYQHTWPLRVWELSMKSSATSNQACRCLHPLYKLR